MGIEEVWSVNCEGSGVSNGLSGLEPERKQHKGASDVESTFGLDDEAIWLTRLLVPALSRDSRVHL